jgi:hypothetical protein
VPGYKFPEPPWWADPNQASVLDPLHVTMARKATGLLGGDDPGGSMMGVATAPMELPGTLVKSLMGLKIGSKDRAAAALYDQLSSVRPSPPDLGAIVPSKVTSMTSPPLDLKTVFSRMLRRVPEAEGQFKAPPALSLKRPTGMPAQYAREASFRSGKPSREANFEKALQRSRLEEIPTSRGVEDLKDFVPSRGSQAVPPVSGQVVGNRSTTGRASVLSRAGLTENIIREIRSLGLEGARQKYPNMNPATLRGIITRDSYGWIQD